MERKYFEKLFRTSNKFFVYESRIASVCDIDDVEANVKQKQKL